MKAAALLLTGAIAGSAFAADALRQLYEQRRWLELREAVAADRSAPPLDAGAAAAAFSQTKQARKLLGKAERAPDAADSAAARKMLLNLYWVNGRYKEALEALPAGAEGDSVRPLLQALSRFPDQALARHKPSRIPYEMKDGNLVVPVSIDGIGGRYILDTGFTNCALGRSEAQRVGLAVADAAVTAGDSIVGGSVPMQAATAARVAIGGFDWRNVACTVLPDSAQPFASLPPGEQGIIGLPLILTFGTWRWTAGGDMEIGFSRDESRDAKPNMWIDGLNLMTRAMLGPGALDMHVDTGATESWLLPRFRQDYPAIASMGALGAQAISQVAGTSAVASLVLPQVTLGIGGFDALLRPCPILLQSSGLAWAHGIAGMDLLRQAHRVSFDFGKMRLSME